MGVRPFQKRTYQALMSCVIFSPTWLSKFPFALLRLLLCASSIHYWAACFVVHYCSHFYRALSEAVKSPPWSLSDDWLSSAWSFWSFSLFVLAYSCRRHGTIWFRARMETSWS